MIINYLEQIPQHVNLSLGRDGFNFLLYIVFPGCSKLCLMNVYYFFHQETIAFNKTMRSCLIHKDIVGKM